MTITLAILSVLVGILTMLQGWQMIKHRNNPNQIPAKLDKIILQLGKMEGQLQMLSKRMDDIWDKVNK